jgi:hypothetical protein
MLENVVVGLAEQGPGAFLVALAAGALLVYFLIANLRQRAGSVATTIIVACLAIPVTATWWVLSQAAEESSDPTGLPVVLMLTFAASFILTAVVCAITLWVLGQVGKSK